MCSMTSAVHLHRQFRIRESSAVCQNFLYEPGPFSRQNTLDNFSKVQCVFAFQPVVATRFELATFASRTIRMLYKSSYICRFLFCIYIYNSVIACIELFHSVLSRILQSCYSVVTQNGTTNEEDIINFYKVGGSLVMITGHCVCTGSGVAQTWKYHCKII